MEYPPKSENDFKQLIAQIHVEESSQVAYALEYLGSLVHEQKVFQANMETRLINIEEKIKSIESQLTKLKKDIEGEIEQIKIGTGLY